MTATNTDTIAIDQFVAAPPSKVWRTLTEPELLARWWVPGDIAAVLGHRFHLQMPGWGAVACEVVEVVPEEKFVYTFNESWTLTWRLVAEGNGTRLLFEHSGFDLDRKSERDAFDRMGPGWRDKVLPQLAQTASRLTD
ncbi:SRPBCC domain-containing protein [Micromonospora sp. NPDC052213]|uniref:SRPBCC family protein n=1 Tax=Micromonospora sp. NPDC052213 TaxID=3155812 RepID=UPI00343F423A